MGDIFTEVYEQLRYRYRLGTRAIPKIERTDNLANNSTRVSPAQNSLQEIRQDLGDCHRCPLSEGRQKIVFGRGNPRARLMFVGEGPGSDEDRQGEPFVGRAGKLLDRIIAAMGLERDDVYIANVVKCRPPHNRDPRPDEVASCIPFLKRQIEAVDPEIVVCLGSVATKFLLHDEGIKISQERGHIRKWQNRLLMPTYHPAYLLRNPAKKRAVWDDMQQVMRELDLAYKTT